MSRYNDKKDYHGSPVFDQGENRPDGGMEGDYVRNYAITDKLSEELSRLWLNR